MKLRFNIIIALILTATMQAMGAESADALLKHVADKLSASRSVTAEFTVSSGAERSKGKLVLAGQRFHISTPELSTWYDGTTQWTFSPTAREVNITEPTADELQQVNPFAVIQAFRKKYSATLAAGKSAGVKTVKLTSKVKKTDITAVTLTIDAATLYPRKIEITTADGRRVTIDVTRVTPGKALPASTFIYNPLSHPGVEIVDLR